jgi:hypothetical protein
MKTTTRPISEINRQATHILFNELGVVETIRFLNQFSVGQGDYTKDRSKWLDNITMDDAIAQIKSCKQTAKPTASADLQDAATLRPAKG